VPAPTNFVMSFCHWAEDSFFGAGVRNSSWLFPFVEIFHLLALGVLGGTFLVLNLRLLGFLFRDRPISELASDVKPWMYLSLGVILVSGFFLFSSESVKMYNNPAFRIKMATLSIAILFSFTLYRDVTDSEGRTTSAIWPKFAAIISILLWSVVGLAGRAIGYVGR
jgi:uncharacterized protein DUF6644